MIKTTDVTTGTEKIFNELRNMPCPHLEYDYNDIKKQNHQDCNCKLGAWCVENKPENCPVIEALLVYIPWKREMLEEEEDWGDYYRELNEYGSLGNDNDLVESYEPEGEDWNKTRNDTDKGWMGFNKVLVTINNVKMYPEINQHYTIHMYDGSIFVGRFLGADAIYIKMWDGDSITKIKINHIEGVDDLH